MADPRSAYLAPRQPTSPYAANMGVDAATLEEKMRGVAAASELGALDPQLEQAAALRDLTAPQGRSVGSQFQAANPLEFIFTAMNRAKGRGEHSQLSDQASALRGEVATGDQAALAAEMQQAQAAAQAKLGAEDRAAADKVAAHNAGVTGGVESQRRTFDQQDQTNETALQAAVDSQQRTFSHQQDAASLLRGERLERDVRADERAIGEQITAQQEKERLEAKATAETARVENQRLSDPVAYKNNETGEVIHASKRRNGNFVDSEGTDIDSLKGWTKVATTSINLGGGYEDETTNREAIKILTLGRKAGETLDIADKFSPETAARLNDRQARIKKRAIQALTPKAFETMMMREYEDDPQVKDFFSKVAAMSSDERHALFGSAVTGNEQMTSEQFLAAVAGLSLEDIKMSVRRSGTGMQKNLESIDDIQSKGGPRKMGQVWNKYGLGERFAVALPSVMGRDVSTIERTPETAEMLDWIDANKNDPLKVQGVLDAYHRGP